MGIVGRWNGPKLVEGRVEGMCRGWWLLEDSVREACKELEIGCRSVEKEVGSTRTYFLVAVGAGLSRAVSAE
jgi:hypothetical protein